MVALFCSVHLSRTIKFSSSYSREGTYSALASDQPSLFDGPRSDYCVISVFNNCLRGRGETHLIRRRGVVRLDWHRAPAGPNAVRRELRARLQGRGERAGGGADDREEDGGEECVEHDHFSLFLYAGEDVTRAG